METTEKFALALEAPVDQLFYDGEKPPQLPNLPKTKTATEIIWGATSKDARYLTKLRRLLARAAEEDRKLLLSMAQQIATHKVARLRSQSRPNQRLNTIRQFRLEDLFERTRAR